MSLQVEKLENNMAKLTSLRKQSKKLTRIRKTKSPSPVSVRVKHPVK